jgi:hypothetical protein
MESTEKQYETEQAYIFEAHPEFRWVFDIEQMAKKWPGYTEALGKAAQEEIVRVAIQNAKRQDSNKGIRVKITGRRA